MEMRGRRGARCRRVAPRAAGVERDDVGGARGVAERAVGAPSVSGAARGKNAFVFVPFARTVGAMPTVTQVKAAARKLPPKDRADLFQTLAQDRVVQKEQLARLRALIDEGDRDLAEGRYIEIRGATELRAFFDDIKRRGRERLKRSA
ncbi:MAG: hypothetical protein RLZZ15_2009 [Verrucomicrobiota bacterium]|jgi:hypothetical protein